MSLELLIILIVLLLMGIAVGVSYRSWVRETGLNERLNQVQYTEAYRVGPESYGWRAASIRSAIRCHRFDDAEEALKKLEADVGL